MKFNFEVYYEDGELFIGQEDGSGASYEIDEENKSEYVIQKEIISCIGKYINLYC